MIRKLLNRYSLFYTAIVFMVVPEFFFRMGLLETSRQEVESEITSYIDKKVKEANSTIETILNDTTDYPDINQINPFFLIYESNKLIWWSGKNTPYVKLVEVQDEKQITCHNFGNGYYLTLHKTKGNKTVVSLIRIYRKYKFANSYLDEKFSNSLNIPEGYTVRALNEKIDEDYKAFRYKGKELFYLRSDPATAHGEISGIIVAIQLGGIFLLFLSLVNFGFIFAHRSPYFITISIILLLIGFKLLFSILAPLGLMKQSGIFNPEIFASNAVDPSLGDFLLTFLAIFCISLFLYRIYFLFMQGNKRKFIFYVITGGFMMTGITFLLISGLKDLVLNSEIDFFFKDINSVNNSTIIGVCALGFGLFAQLFLLSRFRNFYHQYPPMIRILIVMHLGFLLFMYDFWNGQYIYQLSIFSALMMVYIWWPNRIALSPFNSTSVVLIAFAIIAGTVFYEASEEKERNSRILLAEKLADTQDPNMEIEISEFADIIRDDKFFYISTQLGLRNSSENVSSYLDNAYFDNILKDYDINYLIYINDSTPLYPNQYKQQELKDHLRTIALSGKKTASKYLYFIYNKIQGIDYLAMIPIDQIGPSAKLIIEFRSKTIPSQSGLRELLINHNQFYTQLLSEYSFIRFVNNNIVDQRGSYLYKIKAGDYDKYPSKIQFYYELGYKHLLFRPRPETFVVISRPSIGWLAHVTSFSYILILMAIQFSIISILLYNRKIKKGFFNLSAKIQLAFIVLTILAMTLFGLTTQYTISNQYAQKNFNLVAEKMLSITAEIRQHFGNKINLSPTDKRMLEARLMKLSNVFFSDIHFYSPKGILMESSAPKLFRFKILGPLMNPTAFKKLALEGNTRYIQEESIGTMKYISGYVPFYNNSKMLLGYINIPFFPQLTSANNEFSSLLMAIINIFVVLFAFTILLSVLVTQIIISPLRKIRESIATMQLNKVNKPIYYQGKDELADLVKEYNNKVAELEKYAFYLAQNERESAWREMAKQVAHEIKNPLTPMKLNIQHMQRSLKPGDPDFEQRLAKISQSLIEQIDTLTNIASEFSNLAKMPGSKFEKVDYVHLVESVIELYNDDEQTQIILENKVGNAFVNADKEQLLRVLNNLVKNAQQAIPENRLGEIIIRLEKNENKIVTSIIDNGQGIAEEQKSRIFQPDFTTKSTGSGLGLVMVKNIVEQHGGTIQFESAYGSGSTFIFELPVL